MHLSLATTTVIHCEIITHSCTVSTLLTAQLVMNYEMDKVLFVSVCQAYLAVLVSCRVELTMTGPGSFVYLDVPVVIYFATRAK